jgi:8-oxo-dGTP pyrophosphatase MutT (NUDIX family)
MLMNIRRLRAAAIILSAEGQVALIERVRDGRVYYVFPGGGVEAGESPVGAMVREAYEELGVHVEAICLLAIVLRPEEMQYYYLAPILSGEFGSGQGAEMLGKGPPANGTYRAVWQPLDRLHSLDGWPRPLLDRLADILAADLPTEPLLIEDPGSPTPNPGQSRLEP